MGNFTAIKARWVITQAFAEPLCDATIIIHDGIVHDVTKSHVPDAIDLNNSVIIPALVNAHTHLEFCSLSQPLHKALPFTSWIKELMAIRRESAEVHNSIKSGLHESSLSGVYGLGEIATWPAHEITEFNSVDIQAVVFKECIGILPAQIDERYENTLTWLKEARSTPATPILGLSPHAPYSVHPTYFNKLMELAQSEKVPVAMHLAETLAELELLKYQTGEFRTFLEEHHLWQNESFSYNMQIADFLQGLTLAPRASIVHGNYLSEDEINYIKNCPTLTVVYCPRTHAYFKHSPHPWRHLLARGIRVALGTDSKASNPDLKLWGEVKYLHQKFPEVHPQELLQMATINGAYALKMEHQLGRIAPGYLAKFAVAGSNEEITDPWKCLFHQSTDIKG